MDYTGCRPFSDEELDEILTSCAGRYPNRDRLLICLGVYTGFRVSEILSLKVADVSDEAGPLASVRVAKCFIKGKRKSRTMPLHARVQSAVRAWLKDYKYLNWSAAQSLPLFPSQNTRRPLSRRQALNIIKACAGRGGASLDRVGTHSLRRSFARRMWANPAVGRDMARMARLLGHTNFSNTLRYLEFANELEPAVLA